MKYFFYSMAFLVFAVLTIGGFRGGKFESTPIEIFPDMDRQPKVKTQKPSEFFTDGLAMRQPVDGTVPRVLPGNQPSSDQMDYFTTGKMNQGLNWGDGIPMKLTIADLERGQERYAINCAVCHGGSGQGDGIVKEYGLATIVSVVDERVTAQPDGQLFNTITHGYNTMGAYGYNITIEDRWRIIAYLRALQRSQRSTPDQLPADLRAELETSKSEAQPSVQVADSDKQS